MRKVLSFVLVLTLVLSSFSMAFAADSAAGLTDVAGNANADAIQVAYDLDIVTGNPDGTFLPEKAVTRAEFAAMLTRALAIPDSALAGYATTSFQDTAGYTWAVPYLGFCQSKGIMLGDGAGNVMPGRTITVNEAMTMALRAIGYTANSSLLVGAWPANYVSIAQNEELYDDVASATTVDKASAAQIIYNLLTVQKVAVNTDGETTYQETKVDKEDVAANLLNTNLGCTESDDVTIGDEVTYDTSLINITGILGAFGTAYLNDDDDMVAFIPDSVALTGKIDDKKFKVGDVKYEFDDDGEDFTTSAVTFENTYKDTTNGLTKASIETFAKKADDEETVTLNVDLSGKKIKDVYSAVAWSVKYDESSADLAPSDVQEDIEDHELLNADFVEDDDDNIDFNSFQLVGVSSLSDIAEDDVVYVYTDDDGDIRKVAVGTETVEGIVEELDEDDLTVTIDGKEYDIAATGTSDAQKLDVDDDGIFYLDYNGEIYDFDGSGKADTYAVIDAVNSGDSFDNVKLKLYTSDDSNKTFYLNDDADDIDWTTRTAMTTLSATQASVLADGLLMGYSLDSDGDIKAIDATAYTVDANNATFSSIKVLKVGTTNDTPAADATGGSFSIDSEAVVFTYDANGMYKGDYDVCDLDEVEKGTLAEMQFLLNDDGDVVALLISEDDADVEDDAIYGVFNERTKKVVDGDDVYKFSGLIDEKPFTYLTEDDTNDSDNYKTYNKLAGTFGVYGIILDANDTITKINTLDETYKKDKESGKLGYGIVAKDGLESDNTVITIGTDKFTAEDDAVVYEFDDSDNEYSVSKLSAIDEGDYVALYDTKGEDADGVATVVIYIAN